MTAPTGPDAEGMRPRDRLRRDSQAVLVDPPYVAWSPVRAVRSGDAVMNQDVLELPVTVFGSGASRQTRAWRLDVVFDAFGPAFGALDTG